jgi:hypothetical protein
MSGSMLLGIDLLIACSLFCVLWKRKGNPVFGVQCCAFFLLRIAGFLRSFSPLFPIAVASSLLNEFIFKDAFRDIVPMFLLSSHRSMVDPHLDSDSGSSKHWGIMIPTPEGARIAHYRNGPSGQLEPHFEVFRPEKYQNLGFVGFTTVSVLTEMQPLLPKYDMELSGRCQDWCLKMAYAVSTSRTLTYALLFLQPRYWYAILVIPMLVDACVWATFAFPFCTYAAVHMLTLYDFYEFSTAFVSRSRTAEIRKFTNQKRYGFLHAVCSLTLFGLFYVVGQLGMLFHECACLASLAVGTMFARLILKRRASGQEVDSRALLGSLVCSGEITISCADSSSSQASHAGYASRKSQMGQKDSSCRRERTARN